MMPLWLSIAIGLFVGAVAIHAAAWLLSAVAGAIRMRRLRGDMAAIQKAMRAAWEAEAAKAGPKRGAN